MPWAEQREPEFIEQTLKSLEDELNYPLDSEYLKNPVWVVRHQIGHQVAAVVYDGKFGMYKFQFLSGGNTPKQLEGLFRTKEEIIKKAKEYLCRLPKTEESVKSVPFNEEAVEATVEPEKAPEIVKEAKELQKSEEVKKEKTKAIRKVQTQVRRTKKQREKEYKKNLFGKVE